MSIYLNEDEKNNLINYYINKALCEKICKMLKQTIIYNLFEDDKDDIKTQIDNTINVVKEVCKGNFILLNENVITSIINLSDTLEEDVLYKTINNNIDYLSNNKIDIPMDFVEFVHLYTYGLTLDELQGINEKLNNSIKLHRTIVFSSGGLHPSFKTNNYIT